MMFQPRRILTIAATIFPSAILVTKPKMNAVTGMIARMMLRTLFQPK